MNSTIDYYNTHSEQYISATQTLEFSGVQDKFLSLLKPGARILDFGCGSGRDTKYFLDHGFIVDPVDGSEEMVRAASEFAGIPARQMYFNELNATGIYDGIWACASILHVPYSDLSDIFNKMTDALKPGGIIYTSFKYGDFSGKREERFYTDLTPASLSGLVSNINGLSIMRVWESCDVRPGRADERWLNALLEKNK